jgi:uncharacterized protein YxeA
MKKSTTYIVVAVVIVIIIIAAAAAYVYMNPSEGGATPTPTATPLSVAGATSLQFTVDETTSGGSPVTYDYAIRNFNQSNEEVRLDIPGGESGNYSYIIKVADETSYLSIDNGVTWTASDFSTDSGFVILSNDYINNLQNWNGHDETYTYTQGDITNVISAIHVNPPLPDSMFTTS